jgi:hypothetical protein
MKICFSRKIASNSHAIDISIYSDICHIAYGIVSRHDKIGISHDRRKRDCPQKSPMPIHRPTKQNDSVANLAQRLLQAGCIMSSCTNPSQHPAIIANRPGSSITLHASGIRSTMRHASDTGNASPYKDNATPDAGIAHHWQGYAVTSLLCDTGTL